METPAATPTAGIYCKACGYDLRASGEAGRCPECGRAFSPGNPKTFRPRPFAAEWKRAIGRWGRRLAILLLVLAVLLGGPWGWLYLGWHEEQAALEQARIVGTIHPILLGGAPGRWLHDARVPGSFVLERESWAGALSDADLLALRKLHRLEVLSLHGTVTDPGLACLRAFPRLRHLRVWGTSITDAGLETLRDLPGLEFISIEDASVTDAGLVHLGRLPRLEILSLLRMPLTDAGLVHLESLTTLTHLSLWGTRVTDAGLVHLPRLPALCELNLKDTRVTDAGLVHLETLRALKYLNLEGTQVTPAGVARLRAALPDCRISGP